MLFPTTINSEKHFQSHLFTKNISTTKIKSLFYLPEVNTLETLKLICSDFYLPRE